MDARKKSQVTIKAWNPFFRQSKNIPSQEHGTLRLCIYQLKLNKCMSAARDKFENLKGVRKKERKKERKEKKESRQYKYIYKYVIPMPNKVLCNKPSI